MMSGRTGVGQHLRIDDVNNNNTTTTSDSARLVRIWKLLRNEKILIETELEAVQKNVANLNKIRVNIPLLVLQIRELKDNIQRLKNGQISIERALETSYTFSRGNPLGPLEKTYNTLVRFLRLNPRILAHACSSLIFSKSKAESIQYSRDLLASVIVLSFFGNSANQVEEDKLLEFIKTTIELSFAQKIQHPDEALGNDNPFLKRILLMYTRRRGANYIKYMLEDCLVEIFQRENFEVKPPSRDRVSLDLDDPSNQLRIQSRKAANSSKGMMSSKLQFTGGGGGVGNNSSSGGSGSVGSGSSASASGGNGANVGGRPPSPVSAQDAINRITRQTIANLYSICNKIIVSLHKNISAMPHSMRFILKVISRTISTKFPELTNEARRGIVKKFIYYYYLIPGVLEPERFGMNDSPILAEHREKLLIIATVLRNLGKGKEFEETSPYVGMNIFINQNSGILDPFLSELEQEIARDGIKDNTEVILTPRSMSATTVTAATDSSLDDQMSLSPVCVSPAELKLIVSLLFESSLFKSRGFPQDIMECILEAMEQFKTQSQLIPSLKKGWEAEAEKYVILNDYTVKPPEYNVTDLLSPKSSRIKLMLQQIIMSISNISDLPNGLSLERSLELLMMREKVNGHVTLAASIQELLRQMRLQPEHATREGLYSTVFDEIERDAQARSTSIINQISAASHKVLFYIDSLQDQIEQLSIEKAKCSDLIENERARPFLQSLTQKIKEFLSEFKSAAYVEDQNKKLKMFYDRTLKELKKFLDMASAVEIGRSAKILKTFLISKIYLSTIQSYGSIFDKKDHAIRDKIQSLSNFITASHFDIPQKYWWGTTKGNSTTGCCQCVLAEEQLSKLDLYVDPENKIACITKCCTVLFELMKFSDGEMPAADNFLPILIYTIIRVNPPRLHSNLQYVSRFCDIFEDSQEEYLYSETRNYTGEYWLTHFQAAVDYIESVDAASLMAAVSSDKPAGLVGMDSVKFVAQAQEKRKNIHPIFEEDDHRILPNNVTSASSMDSGGGSGTGDTTTRTHASVPFINIDTISGGSDNNNNNNKATGGSNSSGGGDDSGSRSNNKSNNNNTLTATAGEEEDLSSGGVTTRSEKSDTTNDVSESDLLTDNSSAGVLGYGGGSSNHNLSRTNLHFVNATLDSLKWSEIPALLEEYKRLAAASAASASASVGHVTPVPITTTTAAAAATTTTATTT